MAGSTDSLGREVRVAAPPQRIVSLVPSQTELLFDLGLGARIVGRTKFCVHPRAAVTSVPKVGGTKQIDPQRILALRPDFVLANKEENERELVEALEAHVPTWVTDISTPSDVDTLLATLSPLLAVESSASALRRELERARSELPRFDGLRVVYLIWREPWMAAGGGTYIDAMLREFGLVNALGDRLRYPQLDPAEIVESAPDWIFLSSEPYPFKMAHLAEVEGLLPGARAACVDGELFSWFGSRLIHANAAVERLEAALRADSRNE